MTVEVVRADITPSRAARIPKTGRPASQSRVKSFDSEKPRPAVADVVEVMSSHRLCHPALGVEVAFEEISAGNGKRYGVVIVDSCRALFKEERYKPW